MTRLLLPSIACSSPVFSSGSTGGALAVETIWVHAGTDLFNYVIPGGSDSNGIFHAIMEDEDPEQGVPGGQGHT